MKYTSSYKSYTLSKFQSIKHSTYFHVYDSLFSSWQGRDVIFVEVGIFGGGSLFMWRDFFGPKARIIGIDLNPAAKKYEKDGFEIFIGNQSDPRFWEDFYSKVGNIDILLDDGGHTYEQQILTVQSSLSNISDGGLLVVEDTHTSYQRGFGSKIFSFMQFAHKMTDKINMRHHEFQGKIAEHRVWSIRFFESFVVFDINKEALAQKSEVTSNNGYSDGALDYRYADKNISNLFQSIGISLVKKFSILKKFKLVRWSYSLVMHAYNLNLIRLCKLFRSYKKK